MTDPGIQDRRVTPAQATPATGEIIEPKQRGLRRHDAHIVWLPLLLLLAGLIIAHRVAWLHHQADLEQLREETLAKLEPIRNELSRQVFSAVHLSEGIASLIAIEDGIAPARFQALAAELMARSDSIRNIAFAPDNIVTDVYPLVGNEAVLGLRYAETPSQWPGVQRMMIENRLVVAGPVQLVQGGVGIVARRPIRVKDRSGASRYWGLTSTVIDFPTLLGRVAPLADNAELQWALRGVDGTAEQGDLFAGEAAVFLANPVITDVPLPSGAWQLGAIPTNAWPTFSAWRSGAFQFGAIASLALASLIFMLLRIGVALKAEQRALRHAYEIMEQKVVDRTQELRIAKDAAESADRLKSAFLATMSHELRTPLNSIIGFTGIVLQELAGPLTGEQSKQLTMVRDSARHLLALINDVLDISKIEAGELTIANERIELRPSIEKVAAIIRPLAERKGLTLTVSIADDVASMTGDTRRVEQIMLNLLSNAVKFTDKGSVSLCAALVPDEQRDAPGKALRVSVTDTGIGIKPEDMAVLFEPFRQVDSRLSRAHEGTGLGLAICRRLADLMGGVIDASSRWQEGSVFSVTLPLQPAAE